MRPDLPVAPNLDDCGPEEFIFVIASGSPSTPVGSFSPAVENGYKVIVTPTGLDATDFWQRGGPVCWFHERDTVIGRTLRLRIDDGSLEAVVRLLRYQQVPSWTFGASARQRLYTIASNVRVDARTYGAASIGIEGMGLGDWDVDHVRKLIVVHRARLIEWSIIRTGADPNATLKMEGLR